MADPTEAACVYAVELSTLLGKRSGSLTIRQTDGRFTGTLCLMKAENPIAGEVALDGQCSVHGSIRTRMNTYAFRGEGLLLAERLELLLHCGSISLPLCGIRKEE